MAWTYHDYETYTGDTRLTKLRAHIAEVSAEIGPDTGRAGVTRSNAHLVEYVQTLQARLAELEADTETIVETSPRVTSAFTVGRPL